MILTVGFLSYWLPFLNFKESPVTWLPLSNTRIIGVLQRIGLYYFFASMLIRFLSKGGVIVVSILLLLSYRLILLSFGDLIGPLCITKNAVSHLDLLLLSRRHLCHHRIIPFDPESILSTIPAIVKVVIGYYAGVLVKDKGRSYETVTNWLLKAVWWYLYPCVGI